MPSSKPDISIIMPVKNAENFIIKTIESILNQTFENYELIIINDHSTDSTVAKINTFKDERIVFRATNNGYISALNLGIQEASGKYIARMDADDYMHPDRLRLQFKLMEECKDITICTTWAHIFSKDYRSSDVLGKYQGYVHNPLFELWKGNFVIHPTAMFRTAFIKKHNIKYQDYFAAEDYKLWTVLAQNGATFYVLPQCLLFYQIHDSQTSRQHRETQKQMSIQIQDEIEELLFANRPNILSELSDLRKFRAKQTSKEEFYRSYVFSLIQAQNRDNIDTLNIL